MLQKMRGLTMLASLLKIRFFHVTLFLIAGNLMIFSRGSNGDFSENGNELTLYFAHQGADQKSIGNGNPIAPLGVSQKTVNGQNPGAHFGHAVSGAEDIDNDGNSDVIVGEYNYGSGKGRAYIYFGPVQTSSETLILTGENNGDNFGYSVSNAGDVNGDGFPDVIVGAKGYDNGRGKAYIFFGSEEMGKVADITFLGENVGDSLGVSVSGGVDLNSDGYDDVIVGASSYNGAAGRAYIYYGGRSIDNSADVLLNGETSGDYFAGSLDGIPDINGDGYDDIISGANNYNSGKGRAYIFFGGAVMNNTADIIFTGENTNDKFGTAVACAGDVNGDGFADAIVGAHGYSNAKGRAYVFKGGTSPDNLADVTFTGENAGDHFGFAVGSGGDVLVDGYSAAAVGAYGHNSGTGKVYIYYGGMNMNSVADIMRSGPSTGSYLGYSVAEAGDTENDGFVTTISGAFGYFSGKGSFQIFKYSNVESETPDISFTAPAGSGNRFSSALAANGDLNNDGFKDIVTGDYQYSSNLGRIYIYLGSASPNNTPDIFFQGITAGAGFGYEVAIAGDVNGDGYDDILVSAPFYLTNTGRVYLYFGGAVLDSLPDLIITGETTNQQMGTSVDGVGDVNGDGYDDFIVGSGGSKAFLFFGGTNPDNTPNITFPGTASTGFGLEVAGVGDVNNDGFDDFAIGAPTYSTNTGRVFIYYGASTISSTESVLITGTVTSQRMGWKIASAGDVNGDGYDDVLVGAPLYSSSTGRGYLYYGGSPMNNTSDLTFTGEATGHSFAESANKLGDINKDGFEDIAICAFAYGNGLGRIYIYYGGTAMDNVADKTKTGWSVSPQTQLGRSITTGDINNDGTDDIITGGSYSIGVMHLFFSQGIQRLGPKILSAGDVPFDQGGKIKLTWLRSGFDISGSELPITSYILERSDPPGIFGYVWEEAAEITARNNARYAFTATTPNDSMEGTNGRYYFRLTARTSDASKFYRSNIISGYSLDNLAPNQIALFKIDVVNGSNKLSWTRSTDEDLYAYYVYRSNLSSLNPDSTEPIAITRDTFFIDNSNLENTLYYFLRLRDVNGNFSPLIGSSNNPLPVELDLFTARADGRNVHLKWRTQTERNIYTFRIERKTGETGEWQSITEVAGRVNSNAVRHYNYTDHSLSPAKYSYRLAVIETTGYEYYSSEVKVDLGVPKSFELSQNYPNPFNPATTIDYSLPVSSDVKIEVYDILGNKVAELVNEKKEPGYYSILLNAAGFASGVYVYRINAGEFNQIKKMIFMK